ncbi:Breast cancer anti-estrogen resistance protein 1, partial [Dissostichus eleginoides]
MSCFLPEDYNVSMKLVKFSQNVLAKALYDNVAESPDELSFRKGDIMTVLERDTQGLDGWWLCSLHGRQGIVPGNRLKLLVGMYDSKQQQAMPSTPEPASCPSSIQRPLPPLSAYAKPSPATSSATCSSGYPIKPLPSTQYTSMHPAYSSPAQPNLDSVYMMPPSHGPKPSPQSVYQIPSGPSGLPPGPPTAKPLLPRDSTTALGRTSTRCPPLWAPGQATLGGQELGRMCT